MRTRAIYKDYPATIEKFRIDLDKEHFIEFIPKKRTIVLEDGNEKVEKYLHITIYDESIVHQIDAEADLENLTETIRIMQKLVQQLKSDTVVTKCKVRH